MQHLRSRGAILVDALGSELRCCGFESHREHQTRFVMHSLIDLKELLASKGHNIIQFNGWQLETEAGIFMMAFGDYYLDNRVLSKQELMDIVNGKSQKTQSKEPKSRLPDVQTAQGERGEEAPPRKSRTRKSK